MSTETKPDGGPAFARSSWSPSGDLDSAWGMSLRDWFAGMALQGWVASFAGSEGIPTGEKSAKLAYELADAMLKERDKQ